MTRETIVELWRQGHSKEWLINKQNEEIMALGRADGLKKYEIKRKAQSDIEEALLDWWRKQRE